MFIENMFRGNSLWGGIISGGISQLKDTNALTKGHINKKEYAIQTTENVTGAFGVMAGIEYGAVLGTSFMPGVGTIIGSVMGGLLGNQLGRMVGAQTGTALFNNRVMQNITEPTIQTTIRELAVKGKETLVDLTDQIKDAATGMINQVKVDKDNNAIKTVEH
jgi:outer membrane lipoprotein SlyB